MDDPLGDQRIDQFLSDLAALARQAKLGADCPWEPAAKVAFDRIYTTFKRRMFAYVKKKVIATLSIAVDPDEFVPDLFMRFVRGADTFKPANTHSYVDVVRQFLFTLHRHARYMVLDLLDDAKHRFEMLHSAINELADLRGALASDPSPEHFERLRRLHAALDSLDPRGRDVVVTSSPYYDRDEGRFLVPQEVRQALKLRWNLRTDNDLVQCRKRSIASLQKLIG